VSPFELCKNHPAKIVVFCRGRHLGVSGCIDTQVAFYCKSGASDLFARGQHAINQFCTSLCARLLPHFDPTPF
jgi:hypothetical protein